MICVVHRRPGQCGEGVIALGAPERIGPVEQSGEGPRAAYLVSLPSVFYYLTW